MPNMLLNEILGQPGIFNFLEEINGLQQIEFENFPDFLSRCGITSPSVVKDQLTQVGIIFEEGKMLYLSPKGHRTFLLLKALNRGDLKDLVHNLRKIDPTLFPYEIVTEGMTAAFIDGLASLPTFRRVLICSPWVYLKRKILQKFCYAVYKAQEKNPTDKVDIIFIARPLEKKDPNYGKFLECFQELIKVGVEIVVRERLHSKLYIRDPGSSGGFSEAIFGSENLTSKRNIELGMRITNDSIILNKLITYFFDLYHECTPFKEE
jgi:hypothetical protein